MTYDKQIIYAESFYWHIGKYLLRNIKRVTVVIQSAIGNKRWKVQFRLVRISKSYRVVPFSATKMWYVNDASIYWIDNSVKTVC